MISGPATDSAFVDAIERESSCPRRPASRIFRGPLLQGLLLALLAILSSAPSLSGGFLWDDDLVTDNPLLESTDGLRRIWFEPGAIADRDPRYWPLLYTSFWLERRIAGDAPFLYRLDNLLLHAACAVLIWRLLRRAAAPGAWWAGALFAVHPVHAEAVAWIIERKGLLASLFSILALLAFDRVSAPDPGSDAASPSPSPAPFPVRPIIASLILLACACLSKPVAVTLPAVMAIWSWWRRGRIGRHEGIALAANFALAGGLALLTVAVARESDAMETRITLADRILLVGRAPWFYLGKILWPADLMAIYPRRPPDASSAIEWLAPAATTATLLAAVGLAFAARDRRWGRTPLAALLAYGAILFPVLGALPFGFMDRSFVADRYQYLASAAILAPVAGLFAGLARRRPRMQRPLAGLGVVALLGLGAANARECARHRDMGSLFAANARLNPDSVVVQHQLGDHHAARGELDAAIERYERALALDPRHFVSVGNLAVAFARAGREEDALARFLEAERLAPGNANIQRNFAQFLLASGDRTGAEARVARALELAPDSAPSHILRARILEAGGRGEQAGASWEKAAELAPGDFDARTGAGLHRASRRDFEGAREHFAAAARLRPKDAVARNNLGLALADLGRREEAIRELEKALRLRPDLSFARAKLAALRGTSGNRSR